ncbi:M14 family metallopeptidase [Streptomyces sp. XM4011]|uniref:M14 family metallopeptidase n=1 Tax=Streptomyces TaxID=1883 RepID=UPI0015901C78|nr:MULTISPECIES: M14 family metallopeptidase [Streptomyces]MCK1813345.1 M14 family metallopeptidase [Streptomyces sp. XM4011]QKV71180.1 zinc carboxypeptidase [Streptomyces harbinensis]
MRTPRAPQASPASRTARRTRRTRRYGAAGAAVLSLALALTLGTQATAVPGPPDAAGGPASAAPDTGIRQYEVTGVRGAPERSALAATGTAIDEVLHGSVLISADAAEAERLRALGYELAPLPAAAAGSGDVQAAAPSDYHTYESMRAVVDAAVARHPDLVSSQVIGRSHEGRDIIAVKVSADVAVDEDEPEILFTHNQHAREHLTVEMALYTLEELTSGYGSDARITRLLDTREIWLIPSVNPDGKTYDTESGAFRSWRKNRQPNAGSSAIGTDLNRNWDYMWGCCGGSSGSASSATYRGAAPESGPETRVVADFVRSRVVGGEQQITAHIDFHTYGELILWPYGYTYADTAPGLTADDRDAFAAVGRAMAASNGYTPQQSSDLYITDGSIGDWMWAEEGIFSYTFEMYPRSASGGGFYPPGSVIDRETARNREAVLILLENADCMYRSIGKEAQYCS